VVVGTYNDPNTNSLFVVGSGASDTRRKNVFEVTGDGDTKQSRFNIKSNACIAAAGVIQDTATPITTDIVCITACANGAGIILPPTNGGHNILVNNAVGSVNAYVYPPVGGTIRNIGNNNANAPYNFGGSTGSVQFFGISANAYAAY
jgi:hypothetical protein